MELNKTQQNYRDVAERQFDEFVRAFNETYEPRLVKPASEGSHVRVYHYGEGKNKFNICYDRAAATVQATAGATMLDIIRMYLERSGCVAAADAPPPAAISASVRTPVKHETNAVAEPARQSAPSAVQAGSERPDRAVPSSARAQAGRMSSGAAKAPKGNLATPKKTDPAAVNAAPAKTSVDSARAAAPKAVSSSAAGAGPEPSAQAGRSPRGRSLAAASARSASTPGKQAGAGSAAAAAESPAAPEPLRDAPKALKKPRGKKLFPSSPERPPEPAEPERAYKDGYSLSKYEAERFERGVRELENHAAVAKVEREESNAGSPRHTVKICVLGKDKSRMIVQYAVGRKVMQIQGKPGSLADLVQNVFSEEASEKAIIQARVEFNKAREKKPKEKKSGDNPTTPSALQKSLTKSLPNGVRYLSKQSQTYLYYALIDLESNLSNYGGILATAYQGLENLISNLQRSEGIKVKLIGQAYEKDNGKYTLKATYRRRIKSVVYNEVMSALYTEYFDKRHYYTHSDNFSDTARIIQDQAEAKAEFARLVTVIEYNATKLAEIGFTIDNAAVSASK